MFDDPQPDDIVQGGGDKTCTVREFNAMSTEERREFGKGDCPLE
jgi:hypothetical protein